MRKILIMLIVCSVVMFSLSANGQTDGESTVQGANNMVQKEGTITISMVLGAQKAVWEDLASAYMELNPDVKVVVEDKASSTYADWLTVQLASGEVSADIVTNNVVATFINENRFVDFASYLNQKNPYADGKIWKNTMNPLAYPGIGPNREIFQLNLESVQLPWFYNVDIFQEVGVAPPTNWDELIDVCAKLKNAGYTPIALPGDADSFWAGTMGWLVMRYSDQYWKDKEYLAAAQEGDFNYDPEIDGVWEFDVNDKFNDAASEVNFNMLRVAKLIQEGEVGPDSDKYREMFTNFAKIIPEYTGEDTFFGINAVTAQDQFLKGKAAMYLDGSWFAGGFEHTMKEVEDKFTLGYFWDPPMKGNHIAVPFVRKQAGNFGFIGIVNKSKEQNDLSADFMMFYASKQGQAVRFEAMERNNQTPGGGVYIYGVEMPDKWKAVLGPMADDVDCGNLYENPMTSFARGFKDTQESVREYQVNSQTFFKGEITVDEFSKNMQTVCVEAIPVWLETMKYRSDALEDVSKDPIQ